MYVVLGATGNTGSVIADQLLAAGRKVRGIGRSQERLQKFWKNGGEPFVTTVTDREALSEAFRDAEGVYLMIPPESSGPDFSAHQDSVIESFAAAVERAKVKYAVTLSSVGADKAEKTGPVLGLHRMEERLNNIPSLNVLHFRAGYFMENTLVQASTIRQIGVTAGPLSPELKLPMIAARDIGAAVADALLKLDFNSHSSRELLGPRDITMNEVATIIGKAIGKPDLKYMQAPDDQVRLAMMQLGMSADFVRLVLEMSGALNSGHMRALEPRTPQNTTPTTFETFVQEEFVPRYQSAKAA